MNDTNDTRLHATAWKSWRSAVRQAGDPLPFTLGDDAANQPDNAPFAPEDALSGALPADAFVPFLATPNPLAPSGAPDAEPPHAHPAGTPKAPLHALASAGAGIEPAAHGAMGALPSDAAPQPATTQIAGAQIGTQAAAQTGVQHDTVAGEPALPGAPTIQAETFTAPQTSMTETGGTSGGQTEQIDFTSGPVAAFPNTVATTYALPSSLYEQGNFTTTSSFGGASITAAVNVFAGIKGSVALGLGEITPNYPVTIDPNALDSVIDNTVFSIDPSLISTNDASFSLALPTAEANLDVGLQADANLTINFPSVQIGVSVPFYGYVGTSVGLPSLPISLSVNAAYNLAQNATFEFGYGASLTVSEINQSSVNSGTASANGSLPTLTASGSTPSFLTGSVDLVQLLGDLVPESGLGAVDGSVDYSVGSAAWSLFSLPLSVSLGLGETATATPLGIMETATDELNGEVQSGPLGSTFSFNAPASGSGVIPIDISYTLSLKIVTSLGLDGTISLALDGPSVSATVLGVGGLSEGPFGQKTLFSESGEFAQLASGTTTTLLSGSSVVDVGYQATAVSQTITTPSGGVLLNSEDEQLTNAAGVTIAGTTYGIEAAVQCIPVITNAGTVSSEAYHSSNPGTATPNSYGIDLLGGGIVTNTISGVITSSNYSVSAHGSNNPDAGIKLAANQSNDVSNAGLITGFETGIWINGGVLTNAATGTITTHSAYTSYGIKVGGDGAQITNSGLIDSSFGIKLSGDGEVTNTASGVIEGLYTGGISAAGSLILTNSGTITSHFTAVGADGGTVINLAGGLIEGGESGYGVVLQGTTAVLANDGTLAGNGAVYLDASGSNTLVVGQGAVFDGAVQAGYASATNGIYLAAGTTGTLAGVGTEFTGFQSITIGQGATWQIAGNASALGTTTIDGFRPGDTLDFSGLAFSGRGPGYVTGESVQLDALTGLVSIIEAQSLSSSGITLATTQFGGALANEGFNVVSDGHGGTLLEQTGPMNATISTQGLGGIVLAAGSVYASVLTITATGSAADQGSVSGQTVNIDYGIQSQGEAASINNAGSVAGYQDGIDLTQGGTITNLAGGILVGVNGSGIDIAGGAGIVLNSGVIEGATGTTLAAGGTLTNYSGATITGRLFGVDLGPQATGLADLVNEGLVQDTSGTAVQLTGGGFVYNEHGGAIIGGNLIGTDFGVLAVHDFAKVTNCGSISGGTGIDLTAGGFVVNESGTIKGGVVISGGVGYLSSCGSISGVDGVGFSSGGTVVNSAAGTIIGTSGYGVSLGSGSASISDDVKNSGLIEAAFYGAILSAASNTLFNAGTISSINGDDAVQLEGGTSNTLQLAAGFVFGGKVVAKSGAANSIELTASAKAGVLSGLGSSLLGFSTITLDTGAAWTIETTGAEAASLVFSGPSATDTLVLSGGGTLGTNLSGFGTLLLDGPGTFTIASTAIPSAHTIKVGTGAKLLAAGKITGMIIGTGEVEENNGALTLAGGFDMGGTLAGSGTLVLSSASTFTAGANSYASHLLLEANASVSSGATFSLKSGETSVVTASSAQTISVSGGGTLNVNKSVILAASGPGTAEVATMLTNSGTVEVQSGIFALLGKVSNSATMAAIGGKLQISDQVTGTGTLQIGASATLALQDGAAAGETAKFLAGTGELALTKPLNFLGEINGFGSSDIIKLIGTTATSLSFAGGVLNVLDQTTSVAHLEFGGAYTSSEFSLTMSSGTAIIGFHE